MNEKEFCGSYEPGPRKRKGKKIMKNYYFIGCDFDVQWNDEKWKITGCWKRPDHSIAYWDGETIRDGVTFTKTFAPKEMPYGPEYEAIIHDSPFCRGIAFHYRSGEEYLDAKHALHADGRPMKPGDLFAVCDTCGDSVILLPGKRVR